MATFRRQQTGTLQSTDTCTPCLYSIPLCYSQTSSNDLCCGNPTPVTVYILTGQTFDGANPATVLYQSDGTPAADGYYSDDVTCSAPPQ